MKYSIWLGSVTYSYFRSIKSRRHSLCTFRRTLVINWFEFACIAGAHTIIHRAMTLRVLWMNGMYEWMEYNAISGAADDLICILSLSNLHHTHSKQKQSQKLVNRRSTKWNDQMEVDTRCGRHSVEIHWLAALQARDFRDRCCSHHDVFIQVAHPLSSGQ